jgi:hypothetical protein
MRERAKRAIAPGYIFVSSKPQSLGMMGQFRVLHELGHNINMQQVAKRGTADAVASIVVLILLLMSTPPNVWLTASAGAYCALRLLHGRPGKTKVIHEGIADAVAISLMARTTDLELLGRRHRISLESDREVSASELRFRTGLFRAYQQMPIERAMAVTAPMTLIKRPVELGSLALCGALVLWFHPYVIEESALNWFGGLLVLISLMTAGSDGGTAANRKFVDDTLEWLKSVDWSSRSSRPAAGTSKFDAAKAMGAPLAVLFVLGDTRPQWRFDYGAVIWIARFLMGPIPTWQFLSKQMAPISRVDPGRASLGLRKS